MTDREAIDFLLERLKLAEEEYKDTDGGAEYAQALVLAVTALEARRHQVDKLDELARMVKSRKEGIKSVNNDYRTGYISALSAVEGMITEVRG